MFLAMGVGAFGAGIFHLYTHAFFKALLFLGSGAVIHALHGEQDIRNMGGLKKHLPITYWTFLIGSVAIAGIPPLAGFFSKDEILFEVFREGHTVLWVIGALTSLLTAIYMFRLVSLTFLGERRHDAPVAAHPEEEEHADHGHAPAHAHAAAHAHAPAHTHGHAPAAALPPMGVPPPHHGDHGHIHDAPPAMALALIVLAIGSIAAGFIGVPHALGGHNALHAWLEPAFTVEASAVAADAAAGAEGTEAAHGEEALELTLMGISIGIAVIGSLLGWFIWTKRRDIAATAARNFGAVHTLLLNKYYVDEIYDRTVVNPIHVVSREGLWRGVDVKIIDATVNGFAAIVDLGADVLRRLQSGSVRTYAGSVIVGVVVILGYYLWT
jgi:NADH-quinone oxidoreductase subunit L